MIEIPDPDSVEGVADWVELSISVSGNRLSKALVASAIEGAAGQEPAEAFISSVWRELSCRQQLYARSFFRVEDYIIESQLNTEAPLDYLTCLLLSLYGVQGNTHLPGKLFERLVRAAMERYLSGKAVVFGWPFDDNDGSSEEKESVIKRKVKKLANDVGEKFYETPAPRFKDRGVDVIGWVPFSDKRSGQVVILLQCAAGHRWVDKLPVPVDAWCQYIHWASNPIKAFAVPCIINERDWHENSKDKGIIFDRIRILNLLPDGVEEKTLHDELRSWVAQQLSELSA
jgi:hypothetical protein